MLRCRVSPEHSYLVGGYQNPVGVIPPTRYLGPDTGLALLSREETKIISSNPSIRVNRKCMQAALPNRSYVLPLSLTPKQRHTYAIISVTC
jgi:hypothetical protein